MSFLLGVTEFYKVSLGFAAKPRIPLYVFFLLLVMECIGILKRKISRIVWGNLNFPALASWSEKFLGFFGGKFEFSALASWSKKFLGFFGGNLNAPDLASWSEKFLGFFGGNLNFSALASWSEKFRGFLGGI